MNIDIIDSDDDGPPELVEIRESDATFSQEEAPPPRKVPITIVTGTGAGTHPLQPALRNETSNHSSI
jgi:hypothetical protein